MISSWQTSPSLLQLIQFRADSFSRAGISSVFVSCRPKLDNNSEDIFFAAFLFHSSQDRSAHKAVSWKLHACSIFPCQCFCRLNPWFSIFHLFRPASGPGVLVISILSAAFGSIPFTGLTTFPSFSSAPITVYPPPQLSISLANALFHLRFVLRLNYIVVSVSHQIYYFQTQK